ncbi:MAG: peptidoglycan DD-metalloendopeptidase family protein [Ginsengibacter sp.]
MHKPFLFFISLLLSFQIFSQAPKETTLFTPKNYPKGYFVYPIEARVSLSGNYGELRTNHFHMGLDMRSDQVENRRVIAAADGYISRISIGAFGFGRAIYINHPNGLTTLYGHLNDFYPALEKYVKDQQYTQETWAISFDLTPDLFQVKKGQFIAYSGNTGGSAGPHLHFEIRKTINDKVLNPLLFGLLIQDNIPPTISRLYMYDRCFSTYSKAPIHLPIKQTGANYTTVQNVITVNTDKISFGISANDKQGGSNFNNGIYESIIYFNGLPLTGFQMDSVDYNETRYLNAHIDYKTRAGGGPYIQHLSRLPGYPEGVYRDFNSDGVIELDDDSVHEVRIVVKDAHGNSTSLNFKIKKGLITETGNPNKSELFYNAREFHPGYVNVFENEELHVYLTPEALYDSIAFIPTQKASTDPNSYSNIHTVFSGLIPVQDAFTIKIKPTKFISDSLKDKVLIKRTWNGKTEVSQATKEGEWYTSSFRTFGDFELIVDNEAPVIGGFANGANLSQSRSIIFTPRDNNNSIRKFRAEVNGQWLRFTNDKGRNFIYTFDEMIPKGKHTMRVIVEDLAGNVAERVIEFTR